MNSSADSEGDAVATIFDSLPSELAGAILDRREHANQPAIWVHHTRAHDVLAQLKSDHPELVLSDVTAVDHLDKDTPERFCVVYVLDDRSDHRLYRVHAWVPEEDPTTLSVVDLWSLARWGERECHDMFGIVFDGNPDLRRLLMPEDYPGFPLLKDYPLKGKGERAHFPVVTPEGAHMSTGQRVEYPITIGRGLHTPEYLEAMREDSRPRSPRQNGDTDRKGADSEGDDRG